MSQPDAGSSLSLSRNSPGVDATDVVEPRQPNHTSNDTQTNGNTSDPTAQEALKLELIKAIDDKKTDLAASIIHGCENGDDKANILACALTYACPKDSLSWVETFLGLGADAKTKDASGFTPLHYASKNGNADLLSALLRDGHFSKEDVNVFVDAPVQVDQAFSTALHIAVDCGHRKIAELLLHHGADPDVQKYRGTALHRAVQAPKPDLGMINLLLGNRGDPNTAHKALRRNALHFVCANMNAHLGIVNVVLKKITYVNARNSHGATALHAAAKDGNVDSLRRLLQDSLVNKSLEDGAGYLPIFYAATRPENANKFLDCFVPIRSTITSSADDMLHQKSTVSILERGDDGLYEPGGPGFYFRYIRDDSLSAPREDLKFQWIHMPAAGPYVLSDMVTTHFIAKNNHVATSVQSCEELNFFLTMPKSPADLRRPRIICRRKGIIESIDIGETAADDDIKMVITAIPCFNSSIDSHNFSTNSREATNEAVELRNELLTADDLWLCLLGEKHLISTFPHTAQQEDPVVKSRIDMWKVSESISSTPQLAVSLSSVCSKNNLALSELTGCVDSCVRGKDALSHKFKRALAEIPNRSALTTSKISKELSDISAESGLALTLERAARGLKGVRSVITSQYTFMDAMTEVGHKRSLDNLRRQASACGRTLRAQIQKLDDLQASLMEANASLLILLDLKQRQASSIEAEEARKQTGEARDQSTLARHQNQTLMVFTIVTVIFLPLSFIAALLAINITELPHNASGNQQMSLKFVLRYVLGPGLGCATLCILIAFSGTIKRLYDASPFSSGKVKVPDTERGDASKKRKSN